MTRLFDSGLHKAMACCNIDRGTLGHYAPDQAAPCTFTGFAPYLSSLSVDVVTFSLLVSYGILDLDKKDKAGIHLNPYPVPGT
jgi:hypothetical protein